MPKLRIVGSYLQAKSGNYYPCQQAAICEHWLVFGTIFAGIMYSFIRRLLFWFDPEKVHYFSMNLLQAGCRVSWIRTLLQQLFSPGGNPVRVLALDFRNFVGLAAGFDKNARWLTALECLGFGFVEIGTVTPIAQEGNDKPRLFRLPEDKALINRMGFNNEGLASICQRLEYWRAGEGKNTKMQIGGNIGKNKQTTNEDAWSDYEKSFIGLFPHVDYFVVNVSSPNTPGLRELQEKESLRKIFLRLQDYNMRQPGRKPILLKIAPDLSLEQVDDVIALAMEIKLDGLVVANTTISRAGLKTPQAIVAEKGAGGLSGKPLLARSLALVQYIHEKTGGMLPIIASGGIFTAADARQAVSVGAKLVQVWTGFVYEGPAIVKNICRDGST